VGGFRGGSGRGTRTIGDRLTRSSTIAAARQNGTVHRDFVAATGAKLVPSMSPTGFSKRFPG
jgi:hypothetical protein